MKKTLATLACGGALAAGGIFAGTVIGDDGSVSVADRIQAGSFDRGDIRTERAHGLRPTAVAAGGGKKVTVLKGSSSANSVPSGGADAIFLKCPKKYSALSGGFETSGPGLLAANLSPGFKGSGAVDTRAVTVAVVNLSGGTLDWRAWVTCAKGVKDKS